MDTETLLTVDIAKIPPEGLDIAEALNAGELHLEGEGDFELHVGGSVDCHVDRGNDNAIHVRGRVEAELGLSCGRCLEPFDLPVRQEVDLFYLPRGETATEQEEDVALSDHDLVVAYYEGEQLDLGEVIREQFVLALPMKRICKEACAGLCPTCGANHNRTSCECPTEVNEVDPRLQGLKELLRGGTG